MKDAILLKIKDIASKLIQHKATFTSADLADELKHLGISGDSFSIGALVWEAYQKYGFDEAIKSVFMNNAHTQSLVEEFELWHNINESKHQEALSILHHQSTSTQQALTLLNNMLNVPQSPEKQKGIKSLVNKLSGTMGIKKVQLEAEELFSQYSQMVKAYKDAQNEVKLSISGFVELREYITELYRKYAFMLVDVFGDSIKVTFPELFDFDSIKYLDTNSMLEAIELEYTTLSSRCSEMLVEVSDSFKQTLQGAVVAYNANRGNHRRGNQGTLIVAGMNMLSHYVDTGHKTTTLKRLLQELKNAANRDTTLVVGDLGRLSLVHENINEVFIPKAELFLQYAERLLNDDFEKLSKLIYGNESICVLKKRRDELLITCRNLEQELKYEQSNINYYTGFLTECDTLLNSMVKSYKKALQTKPQKPSTLKNIVTFGRAGSAYNRDIYEWQQSSYPLIEKYEGLQVEQKIAHEELSSLQKKVILHKEEYLLAKGNLETIATKIKQEIEVDDNLKKEMLTYLNPIIVLLKTAKDIMGSKLDSKVAEPVVIEKYKSQLLNADTIDRIKDVYKKFDRSTDKKDDEAIDEQSNSQHDWVKKCILLIEEYVKLNLRREDGNMSDDFYQSEINRLRDEFTPLLENVNNQIIELREAIKNINVAINNEDLKQSIAQLANIDINQLNETEWTEFLKGNNSIEL